MNTGNKIIQIIISNFGSFLNIVFLSFFAVQTTSMLSSDAGISSMPSSMISNISETDHNSSTTMIATNNSSHHQEYGNMGCQDSKGGIQN